MSWFDGSFSFARTALSQAQKSIDKVLDIREEGGTAHDSPESGPSSTSSEVAKVSNDKLGTSPKFSTSTPKLSSSRSTPSTRAASSPQKKAPTAVSPSQDSFTSTWGGTWGGADSLWSSTTTPPGKNEPTEKLPATSAAQPDRVASSAQKSRANRSNRREGSASSLDSPPPALMDPTRSPVVQSRTSSRDGKSGNSVSETLSPGEREARAPNSGVARDLQSANYASEKSEPSTVCSEGDVPEKPSVAAILLESDSSKKPASGGEGQTRAESSGWRSTGTQEQLPSTTDSATLSVQHTASRLSGDYEREVGRMDRDGEGEGEVGLVIPPPDTTDGSDTLNREEDVSEQRPTSTSPLSIPSENDSIPREEGGGWTEVPLSQPSEPTEETLTVDSPTEVTDAPSPVDVWHKSPPPSTTTPSPTPVLQPSPISPLPVSHSSLSVSPPPPPSVGAHFRSNSTTPDPITPESTPAPETMSLPLEQSSANSPPLAEHSETEKMAEKVEGEGDVYGKKGEGVSGNRVPEGHQVLRSGGMVLAEKNSGEMKEKEIVSGSGPEDMHAVQQELLRVKKLLEARETRMVEMSREVIQLSETNQELQSRLSAAEHDLHTSQGGVEELRLEFTKRMGITEKKLQTIVKERDSLKKQLQVLATEQNHQRKSASLELSALLKEKEEQIAGLMEEGEKLSKKELQNSNIIKKLKEKNKQNDQLLMAQRQQIEDCEREVSRLKELVKKKEDNEKKYQESLSQLNSIAEQQEKELTALKTERDELVDKSRSLQTNLDNAYKELSELHKVTAVSKSAAHEAVLSAEQMARQELTEALERQRVEHHREKEKLLLEVSELRASVSRCEQQAAWREERMKQEVSDVQQRLQEAEMRNQELTTTISQTTKPFLRQIETLRSAHSAQTGNWENVEADLTHRLVEAQTRLGAAVEKERSATEKALTLQSRITHIEKQTASLRQEKSRLSASLELEKAKAETLEEGQQRESAKMEAMRVSMQQSLEELRKEKEMLERQLEYERVRLEAESRKACLESQEKERLRSQLASSLSRGFSRQSSTASTTHTQSEILEKSLVQQMSEDTRGGSVSGSGTSLYHGRTPPTSASAIEQLQSLLKQKEGELANAQTLVNSLERSRAAMANDLAAVSTQNVDLTEKVDTIPHLKTQFQELQKKNEALLQMYGEKAEQAEELRLDILDLKEMYRQQIDALTKR